MPAGRKVALAFLGLFIASCTGAIEYSTTNDTAYDFEIEVVALAAEDGREANLAPTLQVTSLSPVSPVLLGALAASPHAILFAKRSSIEGGLGTVAFDDSFPILSDLAIEGHMATWNSYGLELSTVPQSILLKVEARGLDSEKILVDIETLCVFPKTPISTFTAAFGLDPTPITLMLPETIESRTSFHSRLVSWPTEVLSLSNIPFQRHGYSAEYVDIWIRIRVKSTSRPSWFFWLSGAARAF